MMGVIAFLFFLILPWFSQFFLYMLNETLSLLGSLYLSAIVSFKGGSSFLHAMKQIVYETYQTYFEADNRLKQVS